MSDRVRPSTADWLKLGGLLVAIGVVAIDIVMVRGRNKLLWNNLALEKTESAKAIKMMEIKSNAEIVRAKQQVKDAEKRVAESNKKVKDAEAELRNKAREMQMANEKKIDELKASYERRIQEMKEDFNNRMNGAKASAKKSPIEKADKVVQPMQELVKAQIRCRRCSGKGTITVKERCAYCGGSGKNLQKSYGARGGLNGTSTSVSTYKGDCPYCLSGPMKGSGSKGYTIERKTCPNCGGAGMVSK